MTGRVAGKVALVTGAARAQGRAHAVRLAEEGADILAIDVPAQVENIAYPTASADDLAETVRLVEATGRRIVSHQVDVRDLDGLTQFVGDGVAELGRLDVVVANAGVVFAGPWRTQTPEVLRTVLDVNLVGVYNTIWATVEHLVGNGGGSIIVISSSNGLKAGPFTTAYNASKHGVIGLAQSFAMELAKDHVRVNTVHPGPVTSGMNAALTDIDAARESNPLLFGMLQGWIPGHMDPVEIANGVVYLASDESRWVTGSALAIDGGMSRF